MDSSRVIQTLKGRIGNVLRWHKKLAQSLQPDEEFRSLFQNRASLHGKPACLVGLTAL